MIRKQHTGHRSSVPGNFREGSFRTVIMEMGFEGRIEICPVMGTKDMTGWMNRL